MTRVHLGQTTSERVGLYVLDLKTRTVDSTRAFPSEPLALSPDETRLAWTPNDQSCCGGLNYTNNQVLVRDLATGRDQLVLDEWKEFGDSLDLDPDDPRAEDFIPDHASFSPNGRRLAITIEHWSSAIRWRPDSLLTLIRSVTPGDRGLIRHGRVFVGWQDDAHVLLGRLKGPDPDSGRGMLDSLFVYDVERDRETPLPLTRILPIGVGP